MSKFYLTTPIYYPNARPHVGSAYTTIVCDVIARYRRMCGDDVAFLTGTDEHGEKLQRAAAQAGMSPGEFVASKRELFKKLWRFLNISDYKFVHTSQNPDHVRSVQCMLRQAAKNRYIEKKKYEGRYCIDDERYISDGPEPANCDICGRPAELISEQNYFFKLSAFQDRLLKLYDEHPEFVRPDFRMNEAKSFVKSGLRDISVSRKRIQWGIPWPDDPEQVFYVWYDALTSYMTGIGFQTDDPARKAEFAKYWPADLHVIGKDILRFHVVYWPAFLMASEMPLPKTVFAHGWIYYEQDKMSKSKGNVVYPEPIVEALDSFGAPGNDALRYYLLREAPFGQDTSFSYEGLIRRYNSDLANDLGNLANRLVSMLNRYFDGKLLSAEDLDRQMGKTPGALEAAGVNVRNMVADYSSQFEAHDFSRALETVWLFIGRLNKYLVEEQPWIKAEVDFQANQAEIALILYIAAEAVRICGVLLYPVMPKSAERIWKQLECDGNLKDQNPADLKWGGLKPGTRVGKPEIIFPRLDMARAIDKLLELEASEQEIEKSAKKGTTIVAEQPEKKPAPAAVPAASDKISIEEFAKVDMRVGEVVSAEPVPGAQKLLKLMVDIGAEVRQVVAGIAGYYQPERLVGMKVVLVTNLQPRKLRGVESNGMIVAASVGEEGKPVLVTFTEDVPKGAKLK